MERVGLMTVGEAAELLRVSPARAYELIRTEVLRPPVVVRLGRQLRINADELNLWLRDGGSGLDAQAA